MYVDFRITVDVNKTLFKCVIDADLNQQNHGSSGELLNLNDSGTSFTAAAVQITSKITSKINNPTCEAHALIMCCVRPRILSTVFVLGKSILTLLIVPHRIHKRRNYENKLSRL